MWDEWDECDMWEGIFGRKQIGVGGIDMMKSTFNVTLSVNCTWRVRGWGFLWKLVALLGGLLLHVVAAHL